MVPPLRSFQLCTAQFFYGSQKCNSCISELYQIALLTRLSGFKNIKPIFCCSFYATKAESEIREKTLEQIDVEKQVLAEIT